MKLGLYLLQAEVLSRHRKSCLQRWAYIPSFLGTRSLGGNSSSLSILAEVGSCSLHCLMASLMPFLRLFFGEAAHSQPRDPAFCCCFGVVLGRFLLQRGDANPTWFGLACGTERGIQFWGKSTQGFDSSFSLFIPPEAVVMVWALHSCGAAVPAGSGCVTRTYSSEDFGVSNSAWGARWEAGGAPSAPPLSQFWCAKEVFQHTHPSCSLWDDKSSCFFRAHPPLERAFPFASGKGRGLGFTF